MCRLRFIEPEKTSPLVKKIFKKMVLIPNLLCIMANSDGVTKSLSNFSNNLKVGQLSEKYRKAIGLAVSQFNHCQYCIALLTSTAVESGILNKQECMEARRMKSNDPNMKVLLKFTKEILEKKAMLTMKLLKR